MATEFVVSMRMQVGSSSDRTCDREGSSSGYMSGCSPISPSGVEDEAKSDIFQTCDWNLQLSECFFSGSDASSLCSAADRKIPTVFRWDGDGQSVFLMGSFDKWKTKIPLVRSQTGFMTIVDIPEGTHEYKYMVDGEWKCLGSEPKVLSDCGTHNNVVTVRSSDCDAFKALNADSGIDTRMRDEDRWTQNIPPRDARYNHLRAGPPHLPPHLVCSVLNQPTSLHVDPTVLSEPNHVLLNHLYTLSIKDGVLVLSSTHRYRRKYITTLLYKPIN